MTKKMGQNEAKKQKKTEAFGSIEAVDEDTFMGLILAGCLYVNVWLAATRGGGPEGYSWWVSAFRHFSTSAFWRHTGQQTPFSLTGCWHSAGGQDSTKHVTWAP